MSSCEDLIKKCGVLHCVLFENPLKTPLSFKEKILFLCGRLYHSIVLNLLWKYIDPKLYRVAEVVYMCMRATENKSAWNPVNAMRFLVFVRKNKWFKNILCHALDNIQDGTQEGEAITRFGEVAPALRIDKPWGWEVILTTVCEGTGEGYAEKYLIIVGPLSNQKHEDYNEGGAVRSAKVETQTNYGPNPYYINAGLTLQDMCCYKIMPGGVFHIAANNYHQPTVKRCEVAIIKETSKPNIGPGSTTRDPNGDPWKGLRSVMDV